MTKIKLIWIILVIVGISGCAPKQKEIKEADVIGISYFYGEGQDIFLLGTSIDKINESYQNDPVERRMIDTMYYATKLVVQDSALDYIAQYFQNNCPVYDSVVTRLPVFGILITSKTDTFRCVINKVKDIEKYATGLIQWIDTSNYKDQLSEVRRRIAPFQDLSN